MDNDNKIDQFDSLREKHIVTSRYLKTPLGINKIKFFNWVGLSFSALSTSYFIHWGLTAPLFFIMGDAVKSSIYVIEWCGYVIVWPIFIITMLIGMQFSVAFYSSTYANTSEKVHDRAERKARRWYQNFVFFERSLDNLFIRITGIAGMIMITYGAVSNFNDMLARDAEIRAVQKEELGKYQNIDELKEELKYWTDRKVNGKGDDDDAADAMINFYTKQIKIYSHRSDSLNSIVYNKAEIRNAGAIDVTASIKFISQGNKILFGAIMIFLLGVIAAANDGSCASMTKIISCYDQAEQAQKMYRQEKAIIDNMIYGNPDGNSGGNSGGKWMESGSGANNGATSGGGKGSLETDLARAIIFAHAKDPRMKRRAIARALGCSHTQVNDVLNLWEETNQKTEAA